MTTEAGIITADARERAARRFALGSFAGAALLVVAAAFVAFEYYSAQVLHEAQEQLRAFARLKGEQIAMVIDRRISDARAFAQRPAVRSLLRTKLPPGRRGEEHRRLYDAIVDNGEGVGIGYGRIAVLDADSVILASTVLMPLNALELSAAVQAMATGEPVVADLHTGAHAEASYGVFYPVLNDDRTQRLGSIYLEHEAATDLLPLLASQPMPNPSAEALLYRRDGGEALLLNPPRHRPNAAPLSLRAPLSDRRQLGTGAIEQGDALLTGVDYRGIRVLGASSRIPNVSWVLAMKLDLEEVERPVRRLGVVLAALTLVLLALIAATARMGWRWNMQAHRLERLALVERRALAAATSLDGYMVVSEPSRRLAEANAALARITGYTEQELLNLKIDDLIADESPQAIAERADRLAQTGSDRFYSRWKRKNGTVIDVEISINLLRIDEQREAHVFVRDVTDAKRLDWQLRRSEERMNLAIEGSNLALWDWNIATGMIYLSERWSLMLGNKPMPVTTTLAELARLSHPDDQPLIEAEIRAVLHGSLAKYSREHRLRKASGDWVWIQTQGEVVTRSAEGRALRMTGTNADVTERKLAESALAHSEERFRGLVELSLVGIYVVDIASATLNYANPHLCHLLGYSEKDVTGMRPEDFVEPEDQPKLAESRARLQRGERSPPFNVRMRRTDGTVREIEMHSTLVNREGKPMLLGLARDVTEHSRMEAQIHLLNQDLERRVAERTRELERTNRELDAFAYSVSHDLRSPARTMLGYTAILLEQAAPEAESTAHLKRIDAGAHQMLRLIDDLLSLSRVSRSEIIAQEVDVSALAREVGRALQESNPSRTCALHIAPHLHVRADPGLMRILLENLLGNAWKFTARTQEARVEVGSRSDGDGTVYFVRDNGAGFDMQFAHKLFGAFQRLHRADEFEGTGIGLSIVKRIVDKHGGRVWAEGRLDAGATVYFALG